MNLQFTETHKISQILDLVSPHPASRMSLELSLHACHEIACPLDLDAMLKAGNTSDVVHDVYGIDRHIDRKTGKLQNCFLPRFSASK